MDLLYFFDKTPIILINNCLFKGSFLVFVQHGLLAIALNRLYLAPLSRKNIN